MTLQDKLYKLRREKGYSQEELAEKLDVSRQAVSKWERGESSPDINNIIAIAKLYDISVDELAGCIRGDESVSYDSAPVSKGISLKKPSCAENAGIADDFIRMSIDGDNADEIYPQNNSAHSQQDIMPDPVPQNDAYNGNTSYTYADSSSRAAKRADRKNKRSFKVFGSNPPANTNSPQKAEFCRKAKKFPFWALMLFCFFFFGGMFDLFGWSWIFFLFIPLYYTSIVAYEKNNMNYFCYPLVATIAFLGCVFVDNGIFNHYSGTLTSIAAIFWFLSIPLYYTGILAYRKKQCKYFCFPVLVTMVYLIFGLMYSRLFTAFLWLFALIPFYYVYSSSIDKRIFGKKRK
ncbi:MAG: helix-turn-helix domain-containing protein [Oscillospiraceae bacterium]